MYTLIHYVKETEGGKVTEYKEVGSTWRLRRTALNYLRDIIRKVYIDKGYATGDITGGIQCYKSEKTDKGTRKIIDVIVKAEKSK